MNKRNIILTCLALAAAFIMVSCEKTFDDDSDFIQGKWQDTAVLDAWDSEDSTDVSNMDYIEFSEHNYDYALRRVYWRTAYIYDTDGDLDTYDPAIGYNETKGHYTISGDTLKIVNSYDVTTTYYIQSIKNDTLRFVDIKGNESVYKRLRQ